MVHRSDVLLLLQICSLFVDTVTQVMMRSQTVHGNVKIPSLHPPTLKASSHEGYIAESAEMGTTVRVSPSTFSDSLQIVVYDDDLKPGMPPAVYEYILTGLGSSIFAVDQRGYVYLNMPYISTDPPNPSKYQLHIEAREVNTTPVRSSEPISVTIHVIDMNDNPPHFSSSVYMANVSASGTDRPVIQIHATDNDAGKNAKINYHLVSVSDGAYNNFRYDNDAHQLNAVGNLKAGKRYEVVLKAVDGDGLSSQALIIVYAVPDYFQESTILNQKKASVERNQIAGLPNFSVTKSSLTATSESADPSETIQTYVTKISEAVSPYSIIFALGDDSTKGQVYHTITGGNEDNKFAISSEIGALITVSSFDREETSLYSLQIETRSSDSDQHLYWTIVQIAIADINDNAPIFTDPQPVRLRVEISDVFTFTPNMYVGQMNVEDPDDGDNGRVALRIAPPMDKLFSINDSGAVTVNGDLLSGHFGEHRMTVIAIDHGDPSLETRVNLIINIENALQSVSSNPIQLSTDSNLERTNLMPNSTFDSATPAMGNRDLEITDLITNMSSEITVAATTQTAIEIPTLRFAPVFDPSEITITVKENQANIELAKLHAYYMDNKPGSITYIILSGDPSLFNVNSFTGSLLLLRPLDMEEKTSYEIRVGTAEAAVLSTQSHFPYTALVIVDVADVNDWTPSFELDSYQFKVHAAAKLGTAIGQIVAYDQDRTASFFRFISTLFFANYLKENFEMKEIVLSAHKTVLFQAPNNEIRYRIKESNPNESYISVDPKSGLLTVTKDLRLLANKKILLNIEAEDGGTLKQSSETLASIDIEPEESVILTGTPSTFNVLFSSNKLQFARRNYSTSLSESVRSPHLLLVLPVLNKSANERFITCSIISGNYGGAFNISTGSEGNCELRTQALLDRETIDYYQLNVSVKTEQQVDYTIVHVTVLDEDDNAPKFIYNNDEYSGYFAALSTDASPFTFVTTVQAEDADLKNSSAIVYSVDPFSVDSKYFMVDMTGGKIRTKMSALQIMEDSQKNYFNFRVIACDSTLTGKKLCSKAEIFVNIISNSNRFILSVLNSDVKTAEREIAKVLREFTGPCKLLILESMEEKQSNTKKQKHIDMCWFAVNPATKRSCKVAEYSKLFDNITIRTVAAKLKPQIVIDGIRIYLKSMLGKNALFFTNFKTASVAMIVLAVSVAVGALIGICAICLCYMRHRMKRCLKREYPNVNQIPKFGTIFLSNPPAANSHDMLYETQMLEMPIEEEDGIMKGVGNGGGIAVAGHGILYSNGCDFDLEQTYRQNYAPNAMTDKRKFSAEENMFAVNERSGMHPQKSKKTQEIVIPAPDYPMDQKKSVC
uniref:Cadherin-related tumor suppressor n=1 Tax=Elaeophora elaphi TaxID=1147741 RepID=A0A0R3RTT8_9BILA